MSKQMFDSLLQDIKSGTSDSLESKLADLSDEQLDNLFREAQPFKSLGAGSSDKIVVGSVSNLREKYTQKLMMTAMVSFMFQMKDEYTVREDQLINGPREEDFMEDVAEQSLPEDFNLDIFRNKFVVDAFVKEFPHEDIKNMTSKTMLEKLSEDIALDIEVKTTEKFAELTRTNKTLNGQKLNDAIEAAVIEQSTKDREVVGRFLEWLFKFDSNTHSQEGQDVNSDDPERSDLSERKGTDAVYDNIPPNDTHCRFRSYYEINYEKLRDATHTIYNVKPDLEHAMIVYDVKNSQSEVDAFVAKYGSTSKYDLVTFPMNRWTLMGPFKENRERVDYYNKHNSIIKQLLDQQEKDAALGEELMKKRVKTKKVKAEKIFGKDSPAFEQYRKMNPSDLEEKYNATMEELPDGNIKVTREVTVDAETGQEVKVDSDGVPSDSLEVPITSINARTGETTQTRIFTQSVEN